MNDDGGKITRREFIRTTAGVTLAGALGTAAGAEEPEGAGEKAAPPAKRSRVVLVRDENVLDGEGKLDGGILRRMLDDGVTSLTGRDDPVKAWKSLFAPGDTVGIKTNVWRYLRTPPELEEGIRDRLKDAGVDGKRIATGDREVLASSLFSEATALVNVRPMRTHHWSGVGSLIKNYIMFHPAPWEWHDDSCADLAGVWDLPVVKGKTRLNVLVMLKPLFHSKGPHAFSRKYTWTYKGLLVGTDPVATDAVGLRILEAMRREHFGADQPLPISPKHIRVAEEKFGLGVADPGRIDLVRLGWEEGVLV